MKSRGLGAIAVVVGRKNSKGLPGKNFRDFLGKPLIEWSIIHALQSRLISSVIVTSDDDRILRLAQSHGVNSVRRPAAMARDQSPVGDAILHAVDEMFPFAPAESTIVLVEATSPLRPRGFIDDCLEEFWASGADSAVSVGKSISQHPLFSVTRSKEGFLTRLDGAPLQYVRRQEIPEVHFLEGSFYGTRLHALRESGQMYSGQVLGIPVSKWQELEIDDMEDFAMAESIGALHLDEL